MHMTTACLKRIWANRGGIWGKNRRGAPARPAWDRQARLRVGVALLLSVFSYLFFSRCVMSTVEIRGLSMSPTLQNGDRFLLNRFSYWYREPQRGDLVVLLDPTHAEYVIKRIVALPLEQVRMKRNIAYINGHRLMEPYLPARALATEDAVLERPIDIPEEHYFVMGDNRFNSEDSRHYGAVPRRRIVGVVKIENQPMAFLRSSDSHPVDQTRMLPLPTISALAAERTPSHVQPAP